MPSRADSMSARHSGRSANSWTASMPKRRSQPTSTASVLSKTLLDEACTRYTGDFLSDFALRKAPAFDEWVAIERQRLRNIAIWALRRLLDLQDARQPADASTMATALRLVTLDPYDEKAHRAIMDGHRRQRRAAAAIAHYQDFRSRLAGDLGVEPEADTTALFEDIAGRRRTGGTPQAESKPVLGSSDRAPRPVQPGSEMVRPARPLARKRRWPWIASLLVLGALGAAGWHAIDRPKAPRVTRPRSMTMPPGRPQEPKSLSHERWTVDASPAQSMS